MDVHGDTEGMSSPVCPYCGIRQVSGHNNVKNVEILAAEQIAFAQGDRDAMNNRKSQRRSFLLRFHSAYDRGFQGAFFHGKTK